MLGGIEIGGVTVAVLGPALTDWLEVERYALFELAGAGTLNLGPGPPVKLLPVTDPSIVGDGSGGASCGRVIGSLDSGGRSVDRLEDMRGVGMEDAGLDIGKPPDEGFDGLGAARGEISGSLFLSVELTEGF